MQLNIKNGEAYRLATELATLTGESLTEAVTKALAERLEQEKRAVGPLGRNHRGASRCCECDS